MGSLPHREGEPFAILLNIRAIKKSGTLDFTRLQERHEASISVGVRFPARFQYTCCVSGRRRNPLHDGDTRFLLKWPSLQAVRKSNPATLKSFYYLNGSRSQTLLEQCLPLLDKAVPVTDQCAVIDSFVLRVQPIARQLQLLQQTLAHFDKQIAQAYAEHEDYPIFASLPGAGPTLGPRLLGTMGSQRERYPQSGNVQCYTGVALVTKRSGGSCYIHRRYLCPKFHKQTFHEYAKESILWCRWAAAYYLQQRTKGSSHHTAVRALAFKWQRIIWRCWQDRVPYDDAKYVESLKRDNNELYEWIIAFQSVGSA
jgi:hypothetical protein